MASSRTGHLEELSRLQEVMGRFVPAQLLRLLGKERLTDLELGDHAEHRLTSLFADLRGFTSLSEELTPSETFQLINELLAAMHPTIGAHGGYIDKFLGDGMLALFPGRADAGVAAALDMQRSLGPLNERRAARGEPPLALGIGLNTGLTMVGTVGSSQRMEGTVLSDAVNVASRIEGLTKTYGARVLISEHTLGALEHPQSHTIRLADRVRVRGKRQPLTVYEVCDGDPPEILAGKRETRVDFEEALAYYHYGFFGQAEALFERVLSRNPGDTTASEHLARCREARAQGSSCWVVGRAFETMAWDPSVALEVPELDEQHQQLYSCVGILMRSAQAGEADVELVRAWGFVERYVVEHFAAEERHMAATAYPFLGAQRGAHGAFMGRLEALRAELSALAPHPIYRLFRLELLVVDWLINHISRDDRHYGRFLRALRREGRSSGVPAGW